MSIRRDPLVRRMFKKKKDAAAYAAKMNKRARSFRYRVWHFSPVSGYAVDKYRVSR